MNMHMHMHMNKRDDGGQTDDGEQSTIPSNNNTNLCFYLC